MLYQSVGLASIPWKVSGLKAGLPTGLNVEFDCEIMAYRTLALNLLISAPSDVPEEDLSVVSRTISQWNAVIGKAFTTTVLPVSWTDHAVSVFGERPQATINTQLVDTADLGLALFNRRLGTPTGTAESGTAEEIINLAEAGKPVSILRRRMPQPPTNGRQEAEELVRLESYLGREVFNRALVLNYVGHAELVQHVNNMLSLTTGAIRQRFEDAENALPESPDVEPADDSMGVWPRIESSETTKQDSSGRIRTQTNWSLILENKTGRPAYNVTFEFSGSETFDFATSDREPISLLAPNASARYPLFFSMGSSRQAECLVTWHDGAGNEFITHATVIR